MTTIQLINVELASGADIDDPSSLASKVIQGIAGQDDVQSLYAGMHVENPTKLAMVIYGKASSQLSSTLKPIAAGEVEAVHVDFPANDPFAETISAPFTEVGTFAFSGGPPSDAHQNIEKVAETFKAAGSALNEWAYGVTQEEMTMKEGVTGKSGILVAAWETLEQHAKVRDTEVFRENMKNIGSGAKGAEVHHVTFRKV